MAQPPAERETRRKRQRRRRGGGERRRPGVLLQEFWNVPNLLTFGRILIIPLFIELAYQASPLASLEAGALFAVAAITDVVDGWLARRMGLVTVIGKFLDPLADKLIVLAAMVMLVRLGRFPAWVAILLLSREFVVTGLRQIAASEGMVIAAGQEGKWKTALQLVGIVALLVHYTHEVDLLVWRGPVSFNAVGQVLTYLSVVFSLWSAGVYFRGFLQMLARRGDGSGSAEASARRTP
ncbi:MAG TPA: CDP-diacylglycerol--glycerol-3-phosphate 3-phosphatidyltransferase [Myxococcaceae bacterium]|nr:CDP-diacylglycerol--glycerol-3-phosphate 3-phosphatidyltransferase [Myxococcaceae bacterium]